MFRFTPSVSCASNSRENLSVRPLIFLGLWTDGCEKSWSWSGRVSFNTLVIPMEMKNGEYPPDKETTARLRKLQKLVMELAERMDFVEQAGMMLFGSVIDLSNRTGTQKKQLNKKVLKAVVKLHRTSWRRRRQHLSKDL
jgi:hypothetical protein